ncbi:hypothetical protein K438DRAFT_1642157 [Mycena galopus ATCC 62051]|nr:hypothetical protein K438DRAFT_1642157 [Mycena galopus ATCC 62051]
MSRASTTDLRPLAETALAGMAVLAQSIENLSQAPGNIELMAKCKAQSQTVSNRFDELYKKAHTILVNTTNLATDITYQQSIIQLRMTRVTGLLKISAELRAGEEEVVQARQDEINSFQKSIDKLEKAKKDAQEKRDEAEKLRIVRDVFTLGLGEVGDWGNLKDAMAYGEKLIQKCNEEVSTSQKAKKTAQDAVEAISAELTRYTTLKSDLDGFDPLLQSQLNDLISLAGDVKKFADSAMDVGVLLSALLGDASVLPVKHTAQQLATSVLAIQNQIGTQSKLSGVFVTNPDGMEITLQAIANSTVEPSPDDDLV